MKYIRYLVVLMILAAPSFSQTNYVIMKEDGSGDATNLTEAFDYIVATWGKPYDLVSDGTLVIQAQGAWTASDATNVFWDPSHFTNGSQKYPLILQAIGESRVDLSNMSLSPSRTNYRIEGDTFSVFHMDTPGLIADGIEIIGFNNRTVDLAEDDVILHGCWIHGGDQFNVYGLNASQTAWVINSVVGPGGGDGLYVNSTPTYLGIFNSLFMNHDGTGINNAQSGGTYYYLKDVYSASNTTADAAFTQTIDASVDQQMDGLYTADASHTTYGSQVTLAQADVNNLSGANDHYDARMQLGSLLVSKAVSSASHDRYPVQAMMNLGKLGKDAVNRDRGRMWTVGPIETATGVVVASGGSDSNSGLDDSNGLATIQEGIDRATGELTILVRPGTTYTENLSIQNGDEGMDGHWFTLKAGPLVPNATQQYRFPVVGHLKPSGQPGYATYDWQSPTTTGTDSINNAVIVGTIDADDISYFRMEGFELSYMPNYAYNFLNVQNVTLHNNLFNEFQTLMFDDTGAHVFNNRYVTLSNNIFHRGIGHDLDLYGHHFQIYNNMFTKSLDNRPDTGAVSQVSNGDNIRLQGRYYLLKNNLFLFNNKSEQRLDTHLDSIQAFSINSWQYAEEIYMIGNVHGYGHQALVITDQVEDGGGADNINNIYNLNNIYFGPWTSGTLSTYQEGVNNNIDYGNYYFTESTGDPFDNEINWNDEMIRYEDSSDGDGDSYNIGIFNNFYGSQEGTIKNPEPAETDQFDIRWNMAYNTDILSSPFNLSSAAITGITDGIDSGITMPDALDLWDDFLINNRFTEDHFVFAQDSPLLETGVDIVTAASSVTGWTPKDPYGYLKGTRPLVNYKGEEVPFDFDGNYVNQTDVASALEYQANKSIYVSEEGNDSNLGLTTTSTRLTLAGLADEYIDWNPGDSLLFAGNDIFRGTLVINASGTVADPINISRYGAGNRPELKGSLDLDAELSFTESNEYTGVYYSNSVPLNGKPNQVFTAYDIRDEGYRLRTNGMPKFGSWLINSGSTFDYDSRIVPKHAVVDFDEWDTDYDRFFAAESGSVTTAVSSDGDGSAYTFLAADEQFLLNIPSAAETSGVTVSVYFRIDSSTAGFGGLRMPIFQFQNDDDWGASGDNFVYVFANNSAGTWYLDAEKGTGNETTFAISTDTWYRVELGGDVSSEEWTFLVDGDRKQRFSDTDLGASGPLELYAGDVGWTGWELVQATIDELELHDSSQPTEYLPTDRLIIHNNGDPDTDGMTLEGSYFKVIDLSGSSHWSISNIEIKQSNNHGILVWDSPEGGIIIDSILISNSYDKGIQIKGGDEIKIATGNFIENSEIHYNGGPGIELNRFVHGTLINWNNLYNNGQLSHQHDIAAIRQSVGGVAAYWKEPEGLHVKNNLVRNTSKDLLTGVSLRENPGGHGIWLDTITDAIAEMNYVINSDGWDMYVEKSLDNIIRYNFLTQGNTGIKVETNSATTVEGFHIHDNIIWNNDAHAIAAQGRSTSATDQILDGKIIDNIVWGYVNQALRLQFGATLAANNNVYWGNYLGDQSTSFLWEADTDTEGVYYDTYQSYADAIEAPFGWESDHLIVNASEDLILEEQERFGLVFISQQAQYDPPFEGSTPTPTPTQTPTPTPSPTPTPTPITNPTVTAATFTEVYTLYDNGRTAKIRLINSGISEARTVKITTSSLRDAIGSYQEFGVYQIQWSVTTGNNEMVVLEYGGTLPGMVAVLNNRGNIILDQFNNAVAPDGTLTVTTNNFLSTSNYTIDIWLNKYQGYARNNDG